MIESGVVCVRNVNCLAVSSLYMQLYPRATLLTSYSKSLINYE